MANKKQTLFFAFYSLIDLVHERTLTYPMRPGLNVSPSCHRASVIISRIVPVPIGNASFRA